MSIVFLDTESRGGVRLPDFLKDCPGLQRVETQEGDLVSTCDPLFLAIPINMRWHDIEDGWKVGVIGDDIELHDLLRVRSDLKVATVNDPHGRTWVVPRVFLQNDAAVHIIGSCLLPLAWGRENGVRVRIPNEEQAKLMAAASAAHAEIIGNTLGSVPIDVVSDWVFAILESTYHLSGEVIEALGLMTDDLAAWIMITAAGLDGLDVSSVDKANV